MTQSDSPKGDFVLNMMSQSYAENPSSTWTRLREENPIFFWPQGQCWILSRYDDADALLKDTRVTLDPSYWKYTQSPPFLSDPDIAVLMESRLHRQSEHKRIRKLVAPSFSPRAVAKLVPMVRDVVEESLARIDADNRETIDFVSELAEPIPLRVISRMLAIPPEEEDAFLSWSGQVVQIFFPFLPPEQVAAAIQATPPRVRNLRRIIAERRRNPGEDMLSWLIQAQEDGDALTDDELLALVALLIAAGSETTLRMLSFGMYHLLSRDAERKRLIAEPERIVDALEESMRFDHFAKGGAVRYTLEDIEIRGQKIPKGEMVMCCFGSAMQDPRVYENPEDFDMDRDWATNLSFGRGAHYCIGVHLARLEGRTVFETLFERYPQLSLAEQPTFDANHPLVRRIVSLPVRLAP